MIITNHAASVHDLANEVGHLEFFSLARRSDKSTTGRLHLQPMRSSNNFPSCARARRAIVISLCVYTCSRLFYVKEQEGAIGWAGYVEQLGLAAWDGYRLSDAIHQFADDDQCEEHSDSIICLYRSRTDAVADMSVLAPILGSFSRKDVPGYASAVLHARLGDGLCQRYDYICRGNRTDIPNCWEHDEDCWFDAQIPRRYTFSRVWYDAVPDKLREYGVKEIVIVGDPRHWTRTPDLRRGDYSVDTAYVWSIVKFFQKFQFSVRVRQPGTPDEDFAYMCSAKVFIQGGGGLSALVSEVVRYQNGFVIVPNRAST